MTQLQIPTILTPYTPSTFNKVTFQLSTTTPSSIIQPQQPAAINIKLQIAQQLRTARPGHPIRTAAVEKPAIILSIPLLGIRTSYQYHIPALMVILFERRKYRMVFITRRVAASSETNSKQQTNKGAIYNITTKQLVQIGIGPCMVDGKMVFSRVFKPPKLY